jgi:hypothetical protein
LQYATFVCNMHCNVRGTLTPTGLGNYAFSKDRISRSTLVKHMACASREQGLELEVGFEVPDGLKLAISGATKENKRIGRTRLLK